MRMEIRAVGRMKSGPERDLADRYLKRAEGAGRPLAIAPVLVRESAESRASRAEDRKTEEAALLLRDLDDAFVLALDERGATLSSEAFADLLRAERDRARPRIALLIGGADGLAPEVLARADRRLAFGTMTWPHQLVRVMLAEQVYRAATIIAGHPYHRA